LRRTSTPTPHRVAFDLTRNTVHPVAGRNEYDRTGFPGRPPLPTAPLETVRDYVADLVYIATDLANKAADPRQAHRPGLKEKADSARHRAWEFLRRLELRTLASPDPELRTDVKLLTKRLTEVDRILSGRKSASIWTSCWR
jgi:hypothetical protein